MVRYSFLPIIEIDHEAVCPLEGPPWGGPSSCFRDRAFKVGGFESFYRAERGASFTRGGGTVNTVKLVRRCFFPMVCMLIGALLSGCGEKALPQRKTYPAKGKILFNGTPASYVIVRFEPVGSEGVEATGRT